MRSISSRCPRGMGACWTDVRGASNIDISHITSCDRTASYECTGVPDTHWYLSPEFFHSSMRLARLKEACVPLRRMISISPTASHARNLRMIAFTYCSNCIVGYGFKISLTKTRPFCCLARILFMNLPPPMDFSYTRSESSGTSIPAEPADRVVRE